MKKFFGCAAVALVVLSATTVLADSNASGGGVTDSESVSLGAGPFSHGAAVGSGDNSVVSGINFSGSFLANRIRFSGTANSLIPATWASEVRMRVSDDNVFTPGTFDFVAGAGQTYTTFDYDLSADITGSWAGGVAPNSGAWSVEFFDSFSDGAGADAESVNVVMTFERTEELNDSNGNWSLGTINGGTVSDIGELALANLFDTYTFSLGTDGTLDILTEFEDVYTGLSLDTEIALFDSSGTLIGTDDDGGPGTYSALSGLNLTAGDYTLIVAGFNSTFADGFDVTPGDSTGDYRVSLSFSAIPEPSMLAALGLMSLGCCAARRRRA
jgi:hypothetical protein